MHLFGFDETKDSATRQDIIFFFGLLFPTLGNFIKVLKSVGQIFKFLGDIVRCGWAIFFKSVWSHRTKENFDDSRLPFYSVIIFQ